MRIEKKSLKFYSNKALHKMLTDSLNSEHLCHAYLLYGAKGIGKKTIAEFIAAGLLCKSNFENKPCGECNSCKKVIVNGHPDLTVVESKFAKNSIHIDTIRDIRRDAYIRPNESEYKVYIIPNAENMSLNAVNALLKVLEEPPKFAVFILTTESKSAVLPTILSRCIPLAVYPMNMQECVDALSEMAPDKSENERLIAAEQSDGILGRAFDILYNEGFKALNDTKLAFVKSVISINEYDTLKAVSSIKNDREMFSALIYELINFMRRAMIVKLGGANTSDECVSELAYKLSLKDIDSLIKLFNHTNSMLESNVSLTVLLNWFCSETIKVIS